MNQKVLTVKKEEKARKIKKDEEIDASKVKKEVLTRLRSLLKTKENERAQNWKSFRIIYKKARKLGARIKQVAARNIKKPVLRAQLRIAEKWFRFWGGRLKKKIKESLYESHEIQWAIRELEKNDPTLAIKFLEKEYKTMPAFPSSDSDTNYVVLPQEQFFIATYARWLKGLRQLKKE